MKPLDLAQKIADEVFAEYLVGIEVTIELSQKPKLVKLIERVIEWESRDTTPGAR